MSILTDGLPIQTVAECIRDRTLLDVRVCDLGVIERCVISQFNIARECDELVVSQRWLSQESGGPGEDPQPEVHNETYQFDAEDVIWLRATTVALESVKPVRREPELAVATPLDSKRIIDEIIRTMAYLTQECSEQDLRTPKGRGDKMLRPRQEAMWLAYEMTDLLPTDICRLHFGYKSPQPLVTISDKLCWRTKNGDPIHYGENPGAWVKRVKTTAAMIEAHFGQRFRRTSASPGWRTYL